MAPIAEWIAQAERIVALTGAGISAESGIPTFRGSGGLWREFRAEDLATPQAFARDPELVWEWYQWRRSLIAQAQPNSGHLALAELERRKPGFVLVTQNVDGLHDRAGNRRVIKLHGDIWTVRCMTCGASTHDERLEFPQMPPRCECGGMLRPGVVWFGEGLPQDAWSAADEACRKADLVLVIGTSAVVYPAASLAPLARRHGAKVVEVNREETPLSGAVDASVRGAAGEILPAWIQ